MAAILAQPKSRRRPRRHGRKAPKTEAARILDALTPELSVQSAIVDHLRTLGWYVCHIPAGGSTAGHRIKMSKQHYEPGFPDLYCLPPEPDAPPILIEVKRPGARDSGVSPEQAQTHRELRARGQEVWVIDDARQLWEEFGIKKAIKGG